jgi:hypothetical protein
MNSITLPHCPKDDYQFVPIDVSATTNNVVYQVVQKNASATGATEMLLWSLQYTEPFLNYVRNVLVDMAKEL